MNLDKVELGMLGTCRKASYCVLPILYIHFPFFFFHFLLPSVYIVKIHYFFRIGLITDMLINAYIMISFPGDFINVTLASGL